MNQDKLDRYMNERKGKKRFRKFAVLFLFFSLLSLIIVVFTVGSSSSNSGGASVTGTITSITANDPATVHVEFTLVNSSNSAGTPNCIIQVSNAGGSYTGDNGADFPIDANATHYYAIDVPVNHDAAGYITTGTVSCS
jgi:hypothetical protein